MKISFNWLKDYIDTDLSLKEITGILTSIGLEVESVESFTTVKGGLEGIVIGEVKSCRKHPDADKLTVTEVHIGNDNPLQIVCGAPNIAPGQKVPVALVGATLYKGEESFVIKNTKIRGEFSEGMICAEDEIGLGTSHEGIMVLNPDAVPGTPAKKYFNVETDYTLEIGLTPNRIDASSHFGVARDLASYLAVSGNGKLRLPSVEDFHIDNKDLHIPVQIENPNACFRYAGITISGVKVGPSPQWLQNRLHAIGQRPINNVVDITNFVLHEVGQPLHAFNADKIKGGKVVVRTLAENSSFITLDEVERKLAADDLMICNTENGMCMAGVFGGIESGVDENTKNLFLESAYFNPDYIRRTSRRHGLFTDASFRFERGVDPNITVWALKRAAMMIKDIAGGTISSEVVDEYPKPVDHFNAEVSYSNIQRLTGIEIDKKIIKTILNALDIEVIEEMGDHLRLKIAPYRVDVQREADVIEEILRIYGYDKVPVTQKIVSSIAPSEKPDRNKLKNIIADMLSNMGFNEMMSNSLTRSAYYEICETFPAEKLALILNPLSLDLNAMRQTLLFGMLESVAYNQNRKNADLKLYEFGNCYSFRQDGGSKGSLERYTEEDHLGLILTGNFINHNWNAAEKETDFFVLKGFTEAVLKRTGLQPESLILKSISNDVFTHGAELRKGNAMIATFGSIHKKWLREFEIKNEVYYADINWTEVLKNVKTDSVSFSEIPKFPEVKRDLAMVIDTRISFADIRELALQTEKKLLKKVFIFDVYQGDNIEKGKKSYAVSFILQDQEKTLTDFQIDKIMANLSTAFEKKLGATIRK
jgi:phenylalanyl-tRNA synthetase beta chain